MKNFMTIFLIALSLPAWTQAPPMPAMLDESTRNGTISVYPIEAIAGEYGTWTVTYTVGEEGIATGGGIRVQCDDEWHAGPRNSANKLQTQDPADNNYITAHGSNQNAKIRLVVEMERENILIKHEKRSLDGRSERYTFVVRVLVEEGTLQKGDTVSVVYGDSSGGSRGYRASAVSANVNVIAAVDENGDNRFRRLEDQTEIIVHAGSAVEMMAHLPSQGVVGQPIRGSVSLVDKEANPIEHAAAIQLYDHTGKAELPDDVKVKSYMGYVEFEITPKQTGVYRFRARTKDFELEAVSNPIIITETEPEWKLYWGDIHSHTHFSWDGVGTNSFHYARYISGLDFYAMTDHAVFPTPGGITRGLSRKNWEDYTALSDQYHAPNDFVTFIAYECSFGTPYGHHIVYFRDQPGTFDYPNQTTLPELWGRLQEGETITIPHHTGKFPGGVDFGYHDENLRRNFEMYSGHGLSETYDPTHPLAFEHSLFTSDAKSLDHPSHYLDALKMGLNVSPIAASDDHRAHPGQPHYGLAGVWANEKTRNSIFDGLYNKQTYATSGAKIILKFGIGGRPAWEYQSSEDSPTFTMESYGTDEIEWVELLRFQPGDESFILLHHWDVDEWNCKQTFRDHNYKPGSIYYCRLKQKRWIRNRPVYAWSSIIMPQNNE